MSGKGAPTYPSARFASTRPLVGMSVMGPHPDAECDAQSRASHVRYDWTWASFLTRNGMGPAGADPIPIALHLTVLPSEHGDQVQQVGDGLGGYGKAIASHRLQ